MCRGEGRGKGKTMLGKSGDEWELGIGSAARLESKTRELERIIGLFDKVENDRGTPEGESEHWAN